MGNGSEASAARRGKAAGGRGDPERAVGRCDMGEMAGDGEEKLLGKA